MHTRTCRSSNIIKYGPRLTPFRVDLSAISSRQAQNLYRKSLQCSLQVSSRTDPHKTRRCGGLQNYKCLQRLLNGLTALSLAIGLLLCPAEALAAEQSKDDKGDGLTIRFKASKDPAIREAQEALVQAWGYASTQYLDPTFNGIDWPQELQVHASTHRISNFAAFHNNYILTRCQAATRVASYLGALCYVDVLAMH